jgi:hypothetical protein
LGVLRIATAESGIRHASARVPNSRIGKRGTWREGTSMNPDCCMIRRCCTEGDPADVKVFLLLIDRALPEIRLLFAQPGYRSSWQVTSEPEVMSCRNPERSGGWGQPATGPSTKNNGACHTGGYCMHYICCETEIRSEWHATVFAPTRDELNESCEGLSFSMRAGNLLGITNSASERGSITYHARGKPIATTPLSPFARRD